MDDDGGIIVSDVSDKENSQGKTGKSSGPADPGESREDHRKKISQTNRIPYGRSRETTGTCLQEPRYVHKLCINYVCT